MTEKQFKINTSEIGYIHIDNPKGEHMSWVELEKTLNRLYAQNKELFKENKELKEELNFYKNQCIDEDIKYLRENTVWEQMPTKTRTYTKTSIREDLND